MTAATKLLNPPRPSQSDESLLRSFVLSGSEDAFTALVEKYLGIVLGIAVRKTGDRALAEEIAQNVFSILARKAGHLKPNPTLAGWIHRVTVIESAEAMRREFSHKTRMNAASKQFLSELGGRDIWQNALPLLDEGIATLARADREIILLRFFERKSFREIGSSLGKSDDAAQKQTERALQKLSAFLKGKGVVVSATALASGMAANVAHAAPATLSLSIAHHAITAASNLAAKTLILKSIQAMTYAKSKAAICGAILLAVPAIVLWSGNSSQPSSTFPSRAAATASSLEASPSSDPSSAPSQDSQFASASATGMPASLSADPASIGLEWEQALLAADPLHRTQRIAQLLSQLTPGNAPAVAAAFERAKKAGLDFADEQRLFLRAWGKVAGSAAVEYATSKSGQGSVDAVAAIAGWATDAPHKAQAWLQSLPEGEKKECLICGLIDGWSTTDFRAAAAYAETRPNTELRNRFRELLLQRSLRAGGIDAAQQWVTGISSDDLNRDYKKRAFSDVVQTMLYRDPAAAAQWISEFNGQPFISSGAMSRTAAKLAETSPTEAFAWLASLGNSDPASVGRSAGAVLREWSQRDATAAGAWLSQNSNHPFYNQMALSYVQSVAAIDKTAANAWAQTIQDEKLRSEALATSDSRSMVQLLMANPHGDSVGVNGVGTIEVGDTLATGGFISFGTTHAVTIDSAQKGQALKTLSWKRSTSPQNGDAK
jgi:RNA polymerase sigma factor (sigma-70 family)